MTATAGTEARIGIWERSWAASGALTVVLFASGLVFADLVGSDHYPALDASDDEVRRYFVNNDTAVHALSFFHTLAALTLLGFAAYLHMVLRRHEDERYGLPALALGGGVTAAVFLLLSAILYRVLAETAVAEDAALAHALLVASYLAGGPAISVPLALLIGAAVPHSLSGSLFPRWIGWLGSAAVTVSVASSLTMVGPTNNHSAVYGVLLGAAVLGFAWLGLASLALALRRRR